MMTALQYVSVVILGFALSACNGGKVDFFHPPTQTNSYDRNSATNLVPASQALVLQPGRTVANGYHGKIQLNPLKGQKLTGGGYTANLKFTARTR